MRCCQVIGSIITFNILLPAILQTAIANTIVQPSSPQAQPALAQPPASPAVTLHAIGQVVKVKGIVKVMGIDKKQRTLSEKSPIFPKDMLITGKDSVAGLRFMDGTLLAVAAQTAIEINKFTSNSFKLILDSGVVDIRPGNVIKDNATGFLVQTPAGDVQVTGKKAIVAYADQGGFAYMGTGKIITKKGVKAVDQQSYITIDQYTSLPLVTSVAPALLSNENVAQADSILATEVYQYGVNSAYTETAVMDVTVPITAVNEDSFAGDTPVDEEGNLTVSHDEDIAPSSDDSYDSSDPSDTGDGDAGADT